MKCKYVNVYINKYTLFLEKEVSKFQFFFKLILIMSVLIF